MSTALAPQRVVSDLVEEYHEKLEALPEALKAYEAAEPTLNMACTIQGTYVGSPVSGRSFTGLDRLQNTLLVSAWKAVYSRLQIDMLASANDKKDWEKFLADPAPFSLVTVREKFGPYLLDPWTNVLRGVAEVFCDLDPAYKSHSKVKIGVKGLPKRVILSYWTSYSGGAKDKLRDMLNAIRAYERRPLVDYGTLEDIIDFNKALGGKVRDFDTGRYSTGAKVIKDGKLYKLEAYRHDHGDEFKESTEGTVGWREIINPEPGIELRFFGGTNTCHVIFKPETLLTINRALAEYYGEVLPDAEDEDAKPRASTAVSKDLAYYPTPAKVVETVLHAIDLEDRTKDRWRYEGTEPKRVLEPSCGDGRFLDAIRKRGHRAFGVEVHAGRAAEARAKGHAVLTANFLECTPREDFDLVVMNPPFYGKHYAKHVRHAMKFLKPGGALVAILPATAFYDHDELADMMKPREAWSDLPVASFAESGTNVPTGILKAWKPEARP